MFLVFFVTCTKHSPPKHQLEKDSTSISPHTATKHSHHSSESSLLCGGEERTSSSYIDLHAYSPLLSTDTFSPPVVRKEDIAVHSSTTCEKRQPPPPPSCTNIGGGDHSASE